jgi:hypothetical protein
LRTNQDWPIRRSQRGFTSTSRRIDEAKAAPVIRLYDGIGNVIETNEHVGGFKEWRKLGRCLLRLVSGPYLSLPLQQLDARPQQQQSLPKSARVLIGVGLCSFRERLDPPFHLGHTNVNKTFLAPRREKRKTTA